MYEVSNKVVLVTTASAIPNNLAIHTLDLHSKAFAIGVVHGGYINVIPLREGDMVSKYIPCVEPGNRPRHVTTTVTQVKWFFVNEVQILAVTSTLGLHLYEEEGRRCAYTHACVDTDNVGDTYARGLALIYGNRLCVGNSSGTIRIFRVSTSPEVSYAFLEKMTNHKKAITDIASDESEELMVSADDTGCLVLWQAKTTLQYIGKIAGSGYTCVSVVLWKGLIVAAYGSGHIRLYDFNTTQLLCEVAAHARWITALDIAPSRGLLLSVSEDSFVKVWIIDPEEKLIQHKFSRSVEDRMLVGGRFLNTYGTEFCVSAFDTTEVLCFSG